MSEYFAHTSIPKRNLTTLVESMKISSSRIESCVGLRKESNSRNQRPNNFTTPRVPKRNLDPGENAKKTKKFHGFTEFYLHSRIWSVISPWVRKSRTNFEQIVTKVCGKVDLIFCNLFTVFSFQILQVLRLFPLLCCNSLYFWLIKLSYHILIFTNIPITPYIWPMEDFLKVSSKLTQIILRYYVNRGQNGTWHVLIIRSSFLALYLS